MYLSKLDLNEKKSFLNLAAIVAEANGTVEECEEYMLDMYCAEMQIENEVEDKTFKENIDALSNSTETVKNIIIFELVGLCLSDGNYDVDERENILEIANQLGVSEDKLALFEKDLSEYTELVTQISEHIFL